jgi:hypothetical protein
MFGHLTVKTSCMKKLYSLLFALTIMTQAISKTTGLSVPNIFPHYGSGNIQGSAGLINSRIIGQTYLKSDGSVFIPFDSITYSYSYGRGGQLSQEDHDDNFVSFDHSYTYLFEQASNSYRFQFHRSQVFGAGNMPQSYTCQSWRVSTNSWRDSSRYLYTYSSDLTKLLKTVFQIYAGGTWGSPHVTYTNTYDNSNNIIKMTSDVFKMDFIYDNNHNVIQRLDSIRSSPNVWHNGDKYLFNYDAANRLITYTIQVFVKCL